MITKESVEHDLDRLRPVASAAIEAGTTEARQRVREDIAAWRVTALRFAAVALGLPSRLARAGTLHTLRDYVVNRLVEEAELRRDRIAEDRPFIPVPWTRSTPRCAGWTATRRP